MKLININDISSYFSSLCDLLKNSIESGASIGFVLPVNTQEIEQYWQEVSAQLSVNHLCFIALDEQEKLLGSVQLTIPTKANGNHRAEVQKLMVHTDAQGQGIAKALMNFAEKTAKNLGLSLLVLDTRLGDTASYLYRKIGYSEAGQIPHFARNHQGGFDATVYFYKQI